MSGHNAQSPAPRSASIGPNGPLQTPTTAPLVNGVVNSNAPQQATGSGGAGGGAGPQMTQQNLNQIVGHSSLIQSINGPYSPKLGWTWCWRMHTSLGSCVEALLLPALLGCTSVEGAMCLLALCMLPVHLPGYMGSIQVGIWLHSSYSAA